MQTKFVYFFKLLTTATQCHDRETYNAVSQYRDLRRMRHTTHVCFGSFATKPPGASAYQCPLLPQ
jgi:hypothetical protein